MVPTLRCLRLTVHFASLVFLLLYVILCYRCCLVTRRPREMPFPSVAVVIEEKDYSVQQTTLYARTGNNTRSGGEMVGSETNYSLLNAQPRILRYIWNDWCGETSSDLFTHPLYPSLPNMRTSLPTFRSSVPDSWYGEMLFGYLRVPVSGIYIISLSGDDARELRIGETSFTGLQRTPTKVNTSENGEIIIRQNNSSPVRLTERVLYFVQAIHMHKSGPGLLEVKWVKPDSDHLELLDSSVFVPMNDGEEYSAQEMAYTLISDRPLFHQNNVQRFTFATGQKISAGNVIAMETCEKFEYRVRRMVKRFDGHKQVKYSGVYPDDNTKLYNTKKRNTESNRILSHKTYQKLIDSIRTYMDRDFSIKAVINVEEMSDRNARKLYLVDLEIAGGNHTTNYARTDSTGISDYVMFRSNEGDLCRPSGYLLNHRRMVHVMVTVSNLGPWIQFFIKEMEALYRAAGDQYFRITVVDFGSVDVNITSVVNKSLLADRISVIQMGEKFVKTLGYQKGAELIENPSDIIFLCDLHLEIPIDMIDRIRKHVIRSKMVYAPVVAKLECGRSSHNPKGLWDVNGYGLLGITKFDWDQIGGMNTEDFADKWGGEDWELIDRIVGAGLQVARHKVPYLYHYHHSKKGMWKGGKHKMIDII